MKEAITTLLQSTVDDDIEKALQILEEDTSWVNDFQFELLILQKFAVTIPFQRRAKKLYQNCHQKIEDLFKVLLKPKHQTVTYYDSVLDDLIANASVYQHKAKTNKKCLEAFADLMIIAHEYRQSREVFTALTDHLMLAQRFIFTDQNIKMTIYIDFFNQLYRYFDKLSHAEIELVIEMLSKAVNDGFPASYEPYFTGHIYFENKQYSQAAPYFKASAEIDPNFIQAFCFHALCFEYQGLSEEAITIYHQALAEHPNDSTMNNNLSYLLAKLERFEEALPYSKKAIRQHSSINNQHTYAFILYKLNQRLEYAEKLLLNAHKQGLLIAQLHLAELYHLQNQSRKAKVWFRKFEKKQEEFFKQEHDDSEYLIQQINRVAQQILS